MHADMRLEYSFCDLNNTTIDCANADYSCYTSFGKMKSVSLHCNKNAFKYDQILT